jgi:murein DD-endopeptidase MepM/ murein hydrolase activator NlpD
MHEGLDIRCLQRDKRGEPTDPVNATADGSVAYINRKSALSNYGNYIILRHTVDGIEVYSTYAHLREVREDLKSGLTVKSGEQIGVMGRTANTSQGISKDRAHVHFELNLLVNERFAAWYKKTYPKQRNSGTARIFSALIRARSCWNNTSKAQTSTSPNFSKASRSFAA